MNFESNSNNDIFNLNKNNFSNNTSGLRAGDDVMFNKKNISEDIISSSSASSVSSAASVSSASDSSSNSGSSVASVKKKSRKQSDSDSSSTASSSSGGSSTSSRRSDIVRKESKSSQNEIIREKKEIIYQLDRLEQRGYKIPFKFNLNSDLEEIKLEYTKLLKEKEIDNSIRFQRKMLMALVTGSEYLNNRYDPFSIQLDGWSEQVHDNINDYDDIFEELHEKYKSSGKKMAPELRLFISLSGSAFMFHLTNRMFKEQPLPDVENVLKSNPDLMKQFQQAAAKEYILPQNNKQSNQINQNSGPGIFGMVSGLFNNINSGSARNNMNNRVSNDDNDSISEIDSIIDSVHKNINVSNKRENNIETLSISDEEITSIIEDTADINILKSNKKKSNNKNIRSLNI